MEQGDDDFDYTEEIIIQDDDEARLYLKKLNLTKDMEEIVESSLNSETNKENQNSKRNITKLIKWSTTNIKNISNYEEELQLLTNKELITILKSSKTNLISNIIDNNKEIQILKELSDVKVNIDDFIFKMHKYYLISISLGLIQKKILLERQAFYNFEHVKEELSKLQDFKNFLLDYTAKQSELQTLIDIDEYFDTVQKSIGARKK
jgi:hypothetical protein